ncbi:M23 family metallopeptidase [Streptomyces macrosporus]|uniref:M23 family metallopeptidase n=1 Tax=Streptomyces macrosporus TaxID=44032 RepID=UPI0031DD4166
MNDRHLSGVSTPADPTADSSYGPYGSPYEQALYETHGQQDTAYGYVTGTFDPYGTAYGDADPLFGPLPGDAPAASPAQAAPGMSPDGSWGSDTGQNPVVHDGYAAAWAHVPDRSTASPDENDHGGAGAYGTDPYAGGQWDTDTGQTPAYGLQVSWDSGAYPVAEPEAHLEHSDHPEPASAYGAPDVPDVSDVPSDVPDVPDAADAYADAYAPEHADGPEPASSEWSDEPEDRRSTGSPESSRPGPSARPGGSRRRRSARPKRSALLTVAVPSVCVMGVTAVAAASVGGVGDESDNTTTQAAADASAIKSTAANSKLDTQLAGLSSEAEGFADRASRTQERIDLKERQEAERKRKAAEAARKEAMRPKFALPVSQPGLSAYYGQAGINWMSLHSGIDFPVSYGTPVMAATDGTVRTQWNSAYGNMAIVTAPDGTETWYCHLSSTRIRTGSVKAGDVIAYSGNSGNSTGPHLHFEVRPGGGSAIDPLAWLRSKGLDPT